MSQYIMQPILSRPASRPINFEHGLPILFFFSGPIDTVLL